MLTGKLLLVVVQSKAEDCKPNRDLHPGRVDCHQVVMLRGAGPK